MANKLGVNLLLWTGNFCNDDIALFDRMRKLGFDGVEINAFTPENVDASLVKTALNDTGMSSTVCVVTPPDGSLIDPDPAVRQNGVDYFKRVIDFAVTVGSELVVGPLYSPVGHLVGRGRTEVEWNHAVMAWKDIMVHAEAASMPIGIEALNRFETYFLNIGEDVVKFADEVDSPLLGLHYDTFHANIEESDPVGAIKKNASRINHFHCSENDRGIVGSGHVPWAESFKALRDINYEGWLVIESFLPGIKEIAAAASIWRELAPSADILAKESLDYIKANF